MARILTFCNADYVPVARNWLRALAEIGLDHAATIVSLDEATRASFASDQVLHRPLSPSSDDLSALWSHRIGVLRELLSSGEAIIHSDADAIWLRDPMPDILASDADMVFSQGTIWPPDVHRHHGIVLCCGFFFLRPDQQVLAFLDAVDARMITDRDDQMAVNRVVAALIDDWQVDDPYEVPFRQDRFIASRRPIRARLAKDSSDQISITVLPHHAYPRLLDCVTDEMVVAHPLSGKSLNEKMRCLGQLGLWLL